MTGARVEGMMVGCGAHPRCSLILTFLTLTLTLASSRPHPHIPHPHPHPHLTLTLALTSTPTRYSMSRWRCVVFRAVVRAVVADVGKACQNFSIRLFNFLLFTLRISLVRIVHRGLVDAFGETLSRILRSHDRPCTRSWRSRRRCLFAGVRTVLVAHRGIFRSTMADEGGSVGVFVLCDVGMRDARHGTVLRLRVGTSERGVQSVG